MSDHLQRLGLTTARAVAGIAMTIFLVPIPLIAQTSAEADSATRAGDAVPLTPRFGRFQWIAHAGIDLADTLRADRRHTAERLQQQSPGSRSAPP